MAKNIQDPGSFKYNEDDIEEVEVECDEDVVNLGEVVLWDLSEVYERLMLASEKAKVRLYITGIVVSLWIICTGLCLFRLILTGELALVGLPTLISVPMAIILRFYYRSG